MEKDHKKELEKIINGIKCPKDFKCYRSGLENLCKTKDIGLQTMLQCLELEPRDCKFSVHFAGSSFCECPLRIYIAKKLRK